MTAPGLRGLALGADRFFCRDGLLEVWLATLVDRMSQESRAPWQESLIEEWRSQATVGFSGVMTSQLDRYVDREERRDELTRICVELRGALAAGQLEPGPLTRRVLGLRARPAVDGSDEHPADGSLEPHGDRGAGLLRVADSMIWLLRHRRTDDVSARSRGEHEPLVDKRGAVT